MRRLVTTGLLTLAPLTGALGQEPGSAVTREWLRGTFLETLGPPSDSLQADRLRLWTPVRGRPETRVLLIQIFEDTSEPLRVRVNALLRLGATGQLQAFEYLRSAWETLPPDSPYRHDVVLALGSGIEPPPDFALDLLERILGEAGAEFRLAAAFALSETRSPRGVEILRRRLPRETSPWVRDMIERRLVRERP